MNRTKVISVFSAAAIIAALIGFGVSSWPAPSSAIRPPIRKIVLVTIDTLRADRLGCYGYGKPTSPSLDAFAAEAVVFERALAPAPWTGPSMAAMITGRYPFETGVYTNQNRLGTGLDSLAELLGSAGLATAWFNTNPVLMLGGTKFGHGFSLVAPKDPPRTKIAYSKLQPAVHEWLEQNADGDFFVWIHNMDPHSPPTEGNPYHKDKSWHVYDGEVRLVDDAMGSLFDKLRSLGIWDETLVIFTADHGEAFSEHMLPGHQNVIYDEVLNVPLIIRYPGAEMGLRSTEPVELVDLYRTITDLAQVEAPSTVRGESLVPILQGKATRRHQQYSYHSRYYMKELQLHYLAIRDRDHKLIARVPFQDKPGQRAILQEPEWSLDQPGTTLELYRYSDDPGEKTNLIFHGAEPGVADRMMRELLSWRDRIAGGGEDESPTGVELDEKTRDTLRRLGYDGD